MKPPKTIKEVRKFLGMVGFYRKHVPNFAKLARPITDLTRTNNPFIWNTNCQEAFTQLKDHLVDAPILVKAQRYQLYILTTDDSKYHVGAVLCQLQHDGKPGVIGYFFQEIQTSRD